MSNFSFLDKHEYYSSFSSACVEAERSFLVSYSVAAMSVRKALELSVKWLYSFDQDLEMPYDERLSPMIHHHSFRDLIDMRLFDGLKFIKDLGNRAVHRSSPIKKEQALYALKCLYDFISWIDYCYSDKCHNQPFDETLIPDSKQESKNLEELQKIQVELDSRDRKLEELIKENEALRSGMAEKREENVQSRNFQFTEISEYETRKLFIDLELESEGWTIGKDCILEEEVTGMPNTSETGYVDYVLYGDNGKPLALIEAKRTSVDPRQGKTQAKLYADCLEAKYGIRPIIFYTNGFQYYLWDDASYSERRVSGIYTKDDLEWTHYKRANKKALSNVKINDDISNRPYQKMAIQSVCDSFERGARKALLVMVTGSGKTRTAISLTDVLLKNGWVKNILFLADRRNLVKQAKGHFSTLLPELSLCNMLDSKDSPESKMVFSTYPTMMNAIDDTKNQKGEKLFTPGHFDLIIIDESHRSIYKKYKAIFDYFDAALIGLTATPKSDIDKNTYTIFDLENEVPTYAYELKDAIIDDYLVPYHTLETSLKLPDDGIRYDDLTDEEKDEFEETFGDGVKEISGEALNKFLFNANTVDIVLEELMTKGIKIEGGDKLGKTIIFAANKKHAQFILDRFRKKFKSYKDDFAQPIYTGIKYVDDTYENFTIKDNYPQIAVSVDMLDTGVDIPEIVNLVFFRKVRSKSKFIQMIGRGTRKCDDLFGVGVHKENFRIFDYCSNFEFFRENKKEISTPTPKSLTENLFNIKVDITKSLQSLDFQEEEYIIHREGLVTELLHMVNHIDTSLFEAKMHLEYVHKYKNPEAWVALSESAPLELADHIALIVDPIEDDELAKRFDYLMLTIEYAELTGKIASKPKLKVISAADKLSQKGTIPTVKAQEKIIKDLLTNEHWENASIFDHEKVRLALRDLIKYIDHVQQDIFYTDFKDEIKSSTYNDSPESFSIHDFKDYNRKVRYYLKAHEDDVVIYKLRHNEPLSEFDIKYLEKIIWNELGTKEDYEKEFGATPLLKMILSIVGMDPETANTIFSRFLKNNALNSHQMDFVNLVIKHIIHNGLIEKTLLNDQPFNKYGSIVELFSDRIDIVKELISEIDKMNQNFG